MGELPGERSSGNNSRMSVGEKCHRWDLEMQRESVCLPSVSLMWIQIVSVNAQQKDAVLIGQPGVVVSGHPVSPSLWC